jgi:hypothetical protein
MGSWYKVTKKINGRLYDYWQRTERHGRSVKTFNKYIGPASHFTPAAISAQLVQVETKIAQTATRTRGDGLTERDRENRLFELYTERDRWSTLQRGRWVTADNRHVETKQFPRTGRPFTVDEVNEYKAHLNADPRYADYKEARTALDEEAKPIHQMPYGSDRDAAIKAFREKESALSKKFEPIDEEALRKYHNREPVATNTTTIMVSVDSIDDAYDASDESELRVINEMASQLRKGAKFPPIKLDQDGNVIDGFHRLEANALAGIEKIEVITITRLPT